MINNKKFKAALAAGDLELATVIARKLYKKARQNGDVEQELELSVWLGNEQASEMLAEYKKQIAYLDRRHAIEESEEYKSESDALKRFMMKEFA